MKAIVFLVVVAVILVGCTTQTPLKEIPPTSQPATPPSGNVVAAIPDSSANPQPAQPDSHQMGSGGPMMGGQMHSTTKSFHIKAFQFGFDPETIEVNKGDTVVLEAETLDVGHGIKIPEFNVNMQLTQVGEVKTVTFVADKAGVFSFFCSIPCGSGHKSMKGTLRVS